MDSRTPHRGLARLSAENSVSLMVAGEAVPLRLRRNPRATRLSLRLDPSDGSVVLTLPLRAPLSQGLAFARSKADWLAARLGAMPVPIPFVDGVLVPLLGADHRLHHDPAARRGVWVDAGIIHVCGQAEHLARRLTDWLKETARREITARAHPMATELNRSVARISLRDTRSRWGSCNTRGHLAFSWRLVLAPPEVLGYVVAHEVAHLVEMNHSPAFWRVVGSLVPEWERPRAWLKEHGTRLQRYG